MKDAKQEMMTELESRIKRLKEHRREEQSEPENQYGELNHAVSRVIGSALCHELEDLKQFVSEL